MKYIKQGGYRAEIDHHQGLAAHPPRPHVGSGVHYRGGLGWVKGRRAYEQSPGPIVSRAGTRLRSPCGAATRQAQANSHNRFNTFVKLSLALLSFLWHAPDVPCSQGLISSSLERFPTFFTNLRNGGGGGGGGGGVHAHLLIKLPPASCIATLSPLRRRTEFNVYYIDHWSILRSGVHHEEH